MNKTYFILSLSLLATLISVQQSQGATLLSDPGTPTTNTLASGSTVTLNQGESVTYLMGVIGDPNIGWSGFGEDQNIFDFTGIYATFSVTNLIGTGGISIDPREEIVTGPDLASGSMQVKTVGAGVEAFTLEARYFQSDGTPLPMGSRTDDNPGYGPMGGVINLSGDNASLGLGLLNSSFNLIQGQNYIPVTNALQNNDYSADDPNPIDAATNGGIMVFDIDPGEIGNIRRVVGTSAPIDDVHYGVAYSLTADSGAFADGATFNYSFDGQIVPEPSMGVLSLVAVIPLLASRRRKSC